MKDLKILETGSRDEILESVGSLRVALCTIGGTAEADCARKVSDALLSGIYRVLTLDREDQCLGSILQEVFEIREQYWRSQNDK